ncbi:hypothetical protein [Pseudobutyrivibrio ruminis]|uniref:hypothetical protein n=1 Tax=Pseudobutyrivibrio ruminis TaxID=46206 RepID=UPI00040287EB|nr:hypothetical protein [Pseudobutyrivibrio ruminis]
MGKLKKDYLHLKIDNYLVNYKSMDGAGYTTPKSKMLMRQKLLEASRGYCMYCFIRIKVDTKTFSNLEHSIEKSKNGTKLAMCRMNISITCPVCNTKYKKKYESLRIKSIVNTIEYKDYLAANCNYDSCTSMCPAYMRLRDRYYRGEYGHIILQPYDSVVKECKVDSIGGNPLNIEYDLIDGLFYPDSSIQYTNEERKFIVDHINYFHLNDVGERTNEIYRFCKDMINDYSSRNMKDKYDNYIVPLFIEKTKELTDDKLVMLCEFIYKCGLITGRI